MLFRPKQICLFMWIMLFRLKNAQFINFRKRIKSCFETIIVIFWPKYDNQTGLPTHSDWLKSQTFILWCNLMKGVFRESVFHEKSSVRLYFVSHFATQEKSWSDSRNSLPGGFYVWFLYPSLILYILLLPTKL